jgi:hypothetical protein
MQVGMADAAVKDLNFDVLLLELTQGYLVSGEGLGCVSGNKGINFHRASGYLEVKAADFTQTDSILIVVTFW